jgi:3-oxoadipate enol-lactonase
VSPSLCDPKDVVVDGEIADFDVNLDVKVRLFATRFELSSRPDLVERLVLVGVGLPDHSWSDTVRRYGEEEDAAVARGDLDAAVEANLRMWVDGPNRRPHEVDASVRSFVGEMQRRALELQAPLWEEVQEELLVPDVGSRFVELRVPALVVVGSEDVSDIHAIADRLASGFRARAKSSLPEPPTCRVSNVPRSSTGCS